MPGDGDWFRFIPAGAGNTNCCWISFLTRTVYPRSRGELPIKQAQTSVTGGLSPLARGTQFITFLKVLVIRFIPASAGNTYGQPPRTRHPAVYPRWRGEHLQGVVIIDEAAGLSPLARGTQVRGPRIEQRPRFIPAGAGNTCPRTTADPAGTVYPRWRGEHIHHNDELRICCGLSPLARGTHRFACDFLFRVRFIPAGAGNTSATS